MSSSPSSSVAPAGTISQTSSINLSSRLNVADYSDPLYLYPSDSSNTILIFCVLTGYDNYAIWSRAMSFSLYGKNKLSFVEGIVPLHANPEVANKWN